MASNSLLRPCGSRDLGLVQSASDMVISSCFYSFFSPSCFEEILTYPTGWFIWRRRGSPSPPPDEPPGEHSQLHTLSTKGQPRSHSLCQPRPSPRATQLTGAVTLPAPPPCSKGTDSRAVTAQHTAQQGCHPLRHPTPHTPPSRCLTSSKEK